jgi:MFS family permease
VNSIINLYRQSYAGLSTPAWMLALVMLINRSGAMVMPFLSIYLSSSLGFNLDQVGICMAAYGSGAVIGGLLGGYLTDKIGHFKVQFYSLMLGGILFGALALIETYALLVISLFLASVIIECLRPANTSSIALYSKPENITRAFSLNRMAINLGFSIGPAIGGLLATISFKLIFIADAFTCIVAGIVFYVYFKNLAIRNPKILEAQNITDLISPEAIKPVKNKNYMLFILLTCLFGTIFFQLFTTLPLFYKEICQLSEKNIGFLLAMNGLIVLVFEMIFVYKYGHRKRYKKLIAGGLILCGIALVMLNLSFAIPIVILSMVILSFGEILAMPFIASIAAESAPDQYRGAYMGLFTVAYSVAFALAPLVGTKLIKHFDYSGLWFTMLVLSLLTALGFYKLIPKMKLR